MAFLLKNTMYAPALASISDVPQCVPSFAEQATKAMSISKVLLGIKAKEAFKYPAPEAPQNYQLSKILAVYCRRFRVQYRMQTSSTE